MHTIHQIIQNVIEQVGNSKENLYQILFQLKDDYELKKRELQIIQQTIGNVIIDVDKLRRLDLRRRHTLAEVSSHFSSNSEQAIKQAYEQAQDVRIQLIEKQHEEKDLRLKRDMLEISLRQSLATIQSAEQIGQQINVALECLLGSDFKEIKTKEDKKLAMALAYAQEKERRRIARDIHDGPAQSLTHIIMEMDMCKILLKREETEAGLKELEILKQSTQQALKEVRQILFDLRSVDLEGRSLKEALQELVSSVEQAIGIAFDMELRIDEGKIEQELRLPIYRLCQEVLSNIRKHANATAVSVRVETGETFMWIKIVDNGIGLDVEQALKSARESGSNFGLVGIVERVEQLGGSVVLDAAVGRGMSVMIKLPLGSAS